MIYSLPCYTNKLFSLPIDSINEIRVYLGLKGTLGLLFTCKDAGALYNGFQRYLNFDNEIKANTLGRILPYQLDFESNVFMHDVNPLLQSIITAAYVGKRYTLMVELYALVPSFMYHFPITKYLEFSCAEKSINISFVVWFFNDLLPKHDSAAFGYGMNPQDEPSVMPTVLHCGDCLHNYELLVHRSMSLHGMLQKVVDRLHLPKILTQYGDGADNIESSSDDYRDEIIRQGICNQTVKFLPGIYLI